MKIILCGGGTSGHINPAVSIAEQILKKEKDAEILFIGRDGGNENNIIKERGFSLTLLKVCGIERKLTAKNFKSLFFAIKARAESKKIIKRFSPDAVIGTGGYVCWPVLKAAESMKIPTFIHESNVTPGLTTKLLAPHCKKVFLGHKKTIEYLKRKDNALAVGNPLRNDFFSISREKARRELGISENDIFIVSFGGSIGAQRLNECSIQLMKNYCAKHKNVRHLHATGKRYYDTVTEEELKIGKNGCKILAFIDNMPTVLKAADIAITRAGAMTLSEIAAAGVAAILVPSPNVTDNHQYKNAKHLEETKAAILIEEKELSEKLLTEKVHSLCKSKEERQRLRRWHHNSYQKNAAEKIYEEIKKASVNKNNYK